LRDYHVQVWVIGAYVIKAQLSPSPRVRHPYFMTSFEKLPGSPVGNGLTDIMSDLQDAGNGTHAGADEQHGHGVRSAGCGQRRSHCCRRERRGNLPVEALARAQRSGGDKSSTANKPIEFFQPESRAQELLLVFKELSSIADDVSAIPKYVQGGSAGGGAGRTASGLAMLMGNASRRFCRASPRTWTATCWSRRCCNCSISCCSLIPPAC
jgi:hypothetical protein